MIRLILIKATGFSTLVKERRKKQVRMGGKKLHDQLLPKFMD
jgi:hypothetical protein